MNKGRTIIEVLTSIVLSSLFILLLIYFMQSLNRVSKSFEENDLIYAESSRIINFFENNYEGKNVVFYDDSISTNESNFEYRKLNDEYIIKAFVQDKQLIIEDKKIKITNFNVSKDSSSENLLKLSFSLKSFNTTKDFNIYYYIK